MRWVEFGVIDERRRGGGEGREKGIMRVTNVSGW